MKIIEIKGFVLGTCSPEQICTARDAAYAAAYAAADYVARAAAYAAADYVARAAAYAAADSAYASHDASYAAANAAYADVHWEDIYKLYLHTEGPRYPFKQEWKTSDVTALVEGIVQDRAFDRMPILADALQDAGLTDPELLTHLQQDQCFLSDWVIWNVMELDK